MDERERLITALDLANRRVAALLDVLAYIVSQGGDILVTSIDPWKLPPNLTSREESNWAEIPDWASRRVEDG